MVDVRIVRVQGLDPTNNATERALRHAVQWRKTSYGTDSVAGSYFAENILTEVATCRQQERNVLDYLTRCCQALYAGTPPPSLLPQTIGYLPRTTAVHPMNVYLLTVESRQRRKLR